MLCELRELRVLYLHANAIFIMSEVYVLAALPHLHTVTLHGNVIETEQGYRWLDGDWLFATATNRLSSQNVDTLVDVCGHV